MEGDSSQEVTKEQVLAFLKHDNLLMAALAVYLGNKKDDAELKEVKEPESSVTEPHSDIQTNLTAQDSPPADDAELKEVNESESLVTEPNSETPTVTAQDSDPADDDEVKDDVEFKEVKESESSVTEPHSDTHTITAQDPPPPATEPHSETQTVTAQDSLPADDGSNVSEKKCDNTEKDEAASDTIHVDPNRTTLSSTLNPPEKLSYSVEDIREIETEMEKKYENMKRMTEESEKKLEMMKKVQVALLEFSLRFAEIDKLISTLDSSTEKLKIHFQRWMIRMDSVYPVKDSNIQKSKLRKFQKRFFQVLEMNEEFFDSQPSPVNDQSNLSTDPLEIPFRKHRVKSVKERKIHPSPISSVSAKRDRNSGIWSCGPCGKIYNNRNSFASHKRTHHAEKIECPNCHSKYTPNYIAEHMENRCRLRLN